MEVPKFHLNTPLREFQEFQQRYDDAYWEHGQGGLADIRHVEHHLFKLGAKVANYVEATEHEVRVSTEQLENEVIPDLLFYALHLANSFGLRLEELYQRRIEANIERLQQEEA